MSVIDLKLAKNTRPKREIGLDFQVNRKWQKVNGRVSQTSV